MRSLIVFIIALMISSNVFAGLPSPSSNPIPSLNKTKNEDVVLTEKVQATIRKNPLLKNQPVSAASNQGVITLQGSVLNKEQETAAIQSAESVPGVKKVKSQLTIGGHG